MNRTPDNKILDNRQEEQMNEQSIDTRVFDYVAGQLNGDSLTEFETQLKADVNLQDAVNQERELRHGLNQLNVNRPISMSNFDTLIERIEASTDSSDQGQPESAVVDFNRVARKKNVATKSMPALFNSPYRIAASLAVCGLISMLILSNGFLGSPSSDALNPAANDFNLLSAQDNVAFSALVNEGRAAKLILDQTMPTSELNTLLSSYQLQLIGDLEQTGSTVFIYSEQAFSSADIDRLKLDVHIKDVILFPAN